MSFIKTEAKTQTKSPIQSSTSVRTGKTVQATAVLVGPGERATRQHAQTNVHTSQDLVPEPTIQDEATATG